MNTTPLLQAWIRCIMDIVAVVMIFTSGLVLAVPCPSIQPAHRTIYASADSYAHSGRFSLDKDGILVHDYGSAYNGLGKWRNPFFISNYALALYRDWLNTQCVDDTLRDNFLKQARWFLKTAEMRGKMAVWVYPFENNHYDLKPGWISGIAQSRIASVLLRAHTITHEDQFKQMAEAAILPYEIPINQGGVITPEHNVIWIEEAADPNGFSYKILNGHITALAGLMDVFQITHDTKLKEVIDKSIAAVKRDISKFDAKFTSLYSLAAPQGGRKIAPLKGYNTLHVSQLLWLYDYTLDPLFLEWASRFQAYDVNADQMIAKRSIDPKDHGPYKAKALYGKDYWSDSNFPTYLKIIMPEPTWLSGVAIHGLTLDKSPHHFTVSALQNGTMVKLSEITDNRNKRIDVNFDTPIFTDTIQIDFFDTNGDKILALQAAMVIRRDPQYAPITNECNYRTTKANDGSMVSNITSAFDDDPTTDMTVYCPGWVIAPVVPKDAQITVVGKGTPEAKFTIDESDNFADWTELGKISVVNKPAPTKLSKRFVRVSFGKDVSAITDVEIAPKTP